jgi:hypothetical protein
MVTLELSMDEADTLAMILKSDLSDLRMEIAGTDSKIWRDEMKRREQFIKRTIERLTPVAALAEAGEDVN